MLILYNATKLKIDLTKLLQHTISIFYICLVQENINGTGAGFTNELRQTLTYGELLKHEFYLILRNFG